MMKFHCVFHLMLIGFCCVLCQNKSFAQATIRTDVLKFQNGKIFLSDDIAETMELSALDMPIVKNKKLDSKPLYHKQSVQLNDSTKTIILISTFLDSVFLFEQLDSNHNLQARGFVTPDFSKELE